jgi:Ca2+/Na+ antiporter
MMSRTLLIGIAVVMGIAVTLSSPLIGVILAAGVWIYLLRMVRKQKNIEFNDEMEPTIAERHLKRLKALSIVAGFSFLVFIVGTIIHNVIYGLSEEEEAVFLLISIVASVVFVVVTAGGVVTFLKGRQETS